MSRMLSLEFGKEGLNEFYCGNLAELLQQTHSSR